MAGKVKRESDSTTTNLVSVFSINLERFPNGVFISQFFSSRSNLNNVASGSVDKFLKQQNKAFTLHGPGTAHSATG